MELIFGLDLGTTSIGFAAIEYDKDRNLGRILRLGTRIFPEARDPDGTPLNQMRRAKRLVRRQLRRRRERRRMLNEQLSKAGLLPKFGTPEWAALFARNDPARGEQPDQLRARGLAQALSPHELGRALYHLAKRRHFAERQIPEDEKPGKADADKDEEKATTARDQTKAALRDSGKTLGEYAASKAPHERKRGIHATREIVRAEFQRLWQSQTSFHPVLGESEFEAAVSDAIFAQKPVFWRRNTLGDCALVPGEAPAAKASWDSQQRRMLEKLNNLAIAGGNMRPLDESERAAILEKLRISRALSWPQVRKTLEPLFAARGQSAKRVKFNLEEGGDANLLGNRLESQLSDIFGAAWPRHPHQGAIREAAHARIFAADYGAAGNRIVIRSESDRRAARAAAKASFERDFGISGEQAQALAELEFAAGWDAYSTKAIRLLMPELEAGTKMGDLLANPEREAWRNRHFPSRAQPTGEFRNRLPSPADPEEQARITKLRNPTVGRVQNELRKVVNNLIDFCGRKPDLIRIELARDIGLSKDQRKEKENAIKAQERKRKAAAKDLEEKGIPNAGDSDIEKWLLWKECAEEDPYTGKRISFDALFRRNEFQVEHIWPRSRSLDDSFRNKTLCETGENLRKRNLTPFECYRSDPSRWAEVKDRISKTAARKDEYAMKPGKVKRFVAETMPDDFASRQLNDTGYAARAAMAYLQKLWPDVGPTAPKTVQAVNGKVTAYLRRYWKLNYILAADGEKTRADHRHHAIDALVVACAHPGMSQRLSNYWQAKDDPRRAKAEEPQLAQPWPSIREDAARAAEAIVVSHRVRKKVSGALHKETVYGDTKEDVTKQRKTYRMFVSRKALTGLSKGDLDDIRDPKVAEIVKAFVDSKGGNPQKISFPPYPILRKGNPAINEPDVEIRKVRVLHKQQLSLMAETSTGFTDLDAKHHIEIYKTSDGKIESEVISLKEAARRLAKREPVIRRISSNRKFLMSLSKGEAVFIEAGPLQGIWIVASFESDGRAVLERHNDAISASRNRLVVNTLMRASPRKVSVDPIGRIRSASD